MTGEQDRAALLRVVADVCAEHARLIEALHEVREQRDAFRGRAEASEAVRRAENMPRRKRKAARR